MSQGEPPRPAAARAPWQDSADPCLYRRHSDTQRQASCPITLWQIDGEAMETATDFILGGSKITADGDYSHEIKRPLLGRKVMTNLDSILKSRDITLLDKHI